MSTFEVEKGEEFAQQRSAADAILVSGRYQWKQRVVEGARRCPVQVRRRREQPVWSPVVVAAEVGEEGRRQAVGRRRPRELRQRVVETVVVGGRRREDEAVTAALRHAAVTHYCTQHHQLARLR